MSYFKFFSRKYIFFRFRKVSISTECLSTRTYDWIGRLSAKFLSIKIDHPDLLFSVNDEKTFKI